MKVMCATCGKPLHVAANPDRPTGVVVYCSWACWKRRPA